MDFGDWELRAWDDIPRGEIDAWARDKIFCRPGNGENVLDVACRIRLFHDQLMRLEQDCIVIWHAGTICLLLACRPHASVQQIAELAATTVFRVGFGHPHGMLRRSLQELALPTMTARSIMRQFWCPHTSSCVQLNGKYAACKSQRMLPPQR